MSRVTFSDRELWRLPNLWRERAARRRALEQACAWDYRVLGHDAHDAKERCEHEHFGGEPCRREYDPWSEDGTPADSRMYFGTGIGSLYDLPGTVHFRHELAGWNLTRTTRRRQP